jgi:hypothetical protein
MFFAVFGIVLWVLTIFQVLVGFRVFKLGTRHRPVHKWTGVAIVVLAPLHGLGAWWFFMGLPFLPR